MMDIEEIKDLIEAARKEHFEDKGLKTCEGIYYANGNDGTDFDYRCNNRVCEFMVLKPDDNGKADDGLIRFLAERGDKYTMYVYDYADPYGPNIKTFTGNLYLSVYDLACHLQAEFDDKRIWDSKVESWGLESSTPLEDSEYDDEYEDEEEYGDVEYGDEEYDNE